MTTNDYFDQEMRVMTPDKVLQPRAFALCWDTADQAERRRRDQKLYHLAVDARGAGGFGVELEAFKAAWTACRAAYQAGPTAFLEQNLETGSWFSAAALMAQPLPELHYVVEGFLPQGLALLASPPKYGKSWLAMQLCLAVSQGQPFLGMPTRQATCLYLALEDGRQRLQKRLARLGGQGSRTLYFETKAITLAEGLLAYLESFQARHPDCRLVVVDTLQKVRGEAAPSSSAYAADYADLGALKAYADRQGVCLLVIHHLRKMTDDADPFNRIAGSNGIFGAADPRQARGRPDHPRPDRPRRRGQAPGAALRQGRLPLAQPGHPRRGRAGRPGQRLRRRPPGPNRAASGGRRRRQVADQRQGLHRRLRGRLRLLPGGNRPGPGQGPG